MISEVYWSYASYIQYIKDGMFIKVYYDNGKIKAIVTENTTYDPKTGVRYRMGTKNPTIYKEMIYNIARMGNEDVDKKEVEKVYKDLEAGKYGASILNNVVEIDGVTFDYYNQSSYFSTSVEFDYEAK